MTRLAEETLAEINEVFRSYDDRGDQHIPKHHLGEAIRALGLNPTEEEIRFILDDLRPIDRLSIHQFQAIFEYLNRQRYDLPSPEEFRDGLRSFDTEGNGLLPANELRHLLTTLGERMSDDEVEELLAEFEDQDGMIAYEDFIRSILKR